ncbi:pyridoxal-phosphate dependent enzyme [Planosporangium flavigriseum]|uniref:1-aminocyclopropane-1-carboxylate deaminase n=1 Tax=Planosporangium flavigriseum TaxID=373681 RepID=A0A8J3LGU7_9ACTN|nr:pyridoxal-phosphate dependent enzyme [Planosporangium flavigriseum]NJC63040.1 pyridoxal-phosphate dependent enzyme [Planosporangium flavigriseum]GIG73088.1 1-aminocyclopropane-1-carboxylate deaminase [Planosporangium flavigriseum]
MNRPRRHLAILPTPLQRLTGLEARLGCGPLYLKRDDLAGFGLAGNKARPLEFLLGEALAARADVLVTAGAAGSNFVAAAAAAARVCGLECDVLVSGPASRQLSVNQEMAVKAGATLHFTGADRDQLDQLVEQHADKLRADGRVPYPVPRGGATATGALGFAYAARELAAQLTALGHEDVVVVLPTGSGASLSGFLAGRAALGAAWRTYGVSVSRPAAQMGAEVVELAAACAALLDAPAPTGPDLTLLDATGPGFGQVTEADLHNALLALHTEGLLFDSTYGAKALTAVLALIEAGERAPVVLWHTGGMPSALKLLATPEVRA